MELILKRIYKGPKYTIGKLYEGSTYLMDTLEDTDRGLYDTMSESEIKDIKVYSETAIPYGTYEIDMETVSPKFSKYPFYMEVCKGKLPRLKNVKGFNGILMHVADGHKGAGLVKGCVGVGENKIKGGLLNGKANFKKLYTILSEAHKKGETITITIDDKK